MEYTFEKMEQDSREKLEALREDLNREYPMDDFHRHVCVYACGSLGRLEMTKSSDLDLFFILMNDGDKGETFCTNLEKYTFFAKLLDINEKHSFKEPSKHGIYWDFISEKSLLDIGSRQEDYNNSFTARMLLILESKPLYNDKEYDSLIKVIVDKYFSDFKKHKTNFYPQFLMNDIQRYWYTLTLNYEYRRDPGDDDNKKYWKRLKLKYARLITCYSMLACLYKKGITPEDVITYIKATPFERLDMVANDNSKVVTAVEEIKNEYKWFIDLRQQGPEWWDLQENRKEAFERADKFHGIVMHKLMKEVADTNPELRERMDLY